MSNFFLNEKIDPSFHLRFELTLKPNNSTEGTNSDQECIAEEHLNDPEIENTAQRRQAIPETNLPRTFPPDETESALKFVDACPNSFSYDKTKQDVNKNEMKVCFPSTNLPNTR